MFSWRTRPHWRPHSPCTRASRRLITSRTHPQLLALQGSLGDDGQPQINGIQWAAPEALNFIRAAAGAAATLFYWEGPERFDVLPLSVATDGAIQHVKFDARRLRPNILIGGVEGLAERTWPGRNLKIGSLPIHAERLRPRCVMTTWDPDTQEQDISVLKRIVRELKGEMSLDCAVLNPGVVRVGDEVTLA